MRCVLETFPDHTVYHLLGFLDAVLGRRLALAVEVHAVVAASSGAPAAGARPAAVLGRQVGHGAGVGGAQVTRRPGGGETGGGGRDGRLSACFPTQHKGSKDNHRHTQTPTCASASADRKSTRLNSSH